MSAPAAPSAWGIVPSGQHWSAGRWSLDVRADELADLRCDGQLVLRAIRAVARDQDWNTAWPTVLTTAAGSTTLTLDLAVEERGLSLSERLTVEADGDRLTVTLEAVAQTSSLTNRTGLVVLHPPRLAGRAMTVGHGDGTEVTGRFPVSLSPHQPARDISSLAWSDHEIPLRMELEGDDFEMEDQRNWSDASYKTYSRSLDQPFPYTVAAGERIRQRVTLVAGAPDPAGDIPADLTTIAHPAVSAIAEEVGATEALRLSFGGEAPLIAVGASTAPDPGPDTRDPVASHTHVELDLHDPAWPAALERARRDAQDLSVLLVSPTPPTPGSLTDVADALRGIALRWCGIVDPSSHVTEPGTAQELHAALGSAVPVVGGARSHYTELNREWHRLPHAALDALVFPISPLFHTLETEQLVESVAMQRVIASEAVARAAGVPVHIGPVTLRPRFNNVATTPSPTSHRTDLAEGYGAHRTGETDPRHASPELAAWAIASAAALAVPGVASLTFFEDWGPRGLRSADGAELPVHAALEALCALQGRELLSGASPDGLLWALGARGAAREAPSAASSDDGTSVLVANLSSRLRGVDLQLPGGSGTPLEIGPWQWRRVDVAGAAAAG